VKPKPDVGASRNMGWDYGSFTGTGTGAVVESGMFLSVSRKKDGKWYYLRDTWNADAPPAPAVPAAAMSPAKK
jgi:hypothetical protein